MRTLAVAVAVLALVGCADDGVYIEVLAPDGMTEVELFVVEGECDAEDTHGAVCRGGLQPASFTGKVNAPIYIRAQDEGETWRVPVENGSAWFRFGLDDTFPLQRVIAVGYQGGRAVQAAVLTQVDLTDTRRIVVALDDVVAWENENDEPGAKRALVQWADRRCIGVREGTSAWFIVTEGDADCDELPAAAECDPLAYLVDLGSDTPCLSDANGQCSLGTTTGCSETNPDATSGPACVPGNIDVDPDVCATCGGGPGNDACVAPVVLEGTPRVVCRFGYSLVGPRRPCLETTAGFGPTQIVRANMLAFCPTDFGIALAELPFEGFNFELDGLDARIKLSDVDGVANCVKVEWIAVDAGNVDVTPQSQIHLFWSSGDTVGPNHVMPFEVNFEPGCELEPRCQLLTE